MTEPFADRDHYVPRTADDDHTFSLRGVPGSRNLIVVCSCGWESEPVHLINTGAVRREHRAEVAGDA